MTSAGRFRSAARHAFPQSNYVCFQCQLRASTAVRMTNPSISLPHASRRHASWLDTQKLRKKIWGTDNPPGQEDPYGKESAFDRRRRESEQETEQETEKERELESAPDEEVPTNEEDYLEAITAKGLKTVGMPDWGMKQWSKAEENRFEGFDRFCCMRCDCY